MFDSGYVAGCNIYYSITKLVHMNQIFSLMTVTSCNIGGIIGGFFGGFVLSVVNSHCHHHHHLLSDEEEDRQVG